MIRRHPVRGFFGGFLIGLGISLLLVIYGTAPFGAATIVVITLVLALLGVLVAWFLPPRHRVLAEPVAAPARTTVVETREPAADAAERVNDHHHRP